MSAGLPRDPMSAAAVGLGGKPMPIDAGMFNDRVFSYVACFGVFSRTSYGTDRELKNRIGHLAYILTGIQEIGHLQSYPVRLDCDGDEISGDFFFGSFCNTKSLGGALKLPLSREDLQDGQHELLMVTDMLMKAVDRGVAYVPGTYFYPNGGHDNTLRLNFSNSDLPVIKRGMSLLEECLTADI